MDEKYLFNPGDLVVVDKNLVIGGAVDVRWGGRCGLVVDHRKVHDSAGGLWICTIMIDGKKFNFSDRFISAVT